MTTTRERLERRWTPGRVVLLVVGIVVALLLVAAGVALWWLPPVLAETPRERLAAPTRVTVQDARGSAGVEVASGWVPLGVGPFLPADEVTLLSPDGVYRAELGLAELPDTSPAAVSTALSTLLAEHDLGDDEAGAPTSSPSVAAGVATPTAGSSIDAGAVAGGWSEETLTSGATVRYADVVRGDTSYTVAILFFPTASAAASAGIAADALALTLVASMPRSDAAAYRTVTADLVASAAVAPHPAAAPPTAAAADMAPVLLVTPPTAGGVPVLLATPAAIGSTPTGGTR